MQNVEIWKKIINNIKKYRNMKGYTQAEISELLFISLSYYKQIESINFHKTCSFDLLISIAKVLEIDIIDLLR